MSGGSNAIICRRPLRLLWRVPAFTKFGDTSRIEVRLAAIRSIAQPEVSHHSPPEMPAHYRSLHASVWGTDPLDELCG
jgi:hypothetical protein